MNTTRHPPNEQKAEPIHFVWIGPPKFTEGGHDVIGIDSFVKNFKKFHQPNPLYFFCQEAYLDQYLKYFKNHQPQVHVLSIESKLNEFSVCTDPYLRKRSRQAHHIYTQLMSKRRQNNISSRVKIKDYVRIKNLFFLLLASSIGGYVLDTNIRAIPHVPLVFPSYETFHFPWTADDQDEGIAEVWMLYSPRDYLDRARSSLNLLIKPYLQLNYLYDDSTLPFKKFGTGEMIVRAVTLNYPFDKKFSENNIWETREVANSEFFVVGLNVIKEYYNSHKGNEYSLSSIQMHAHLAEIEKITTDLHYGINPKSYIRNTDHHYSKSNYDAINESLLHIVMRNLSYGNEEKNLFCAKIYLEHGADPNAIYQYTLYDEEGNVQNSSERSALYEALSARSTAAIDLLGEYHVDPNQVLNDLCMLLFAIDLNFIEGVNKLLHYGANPNQLSQDQSISALAISVYRQNLALTKMLLEYGANPNQMSLYERFESNIMLYATPLYIAIDLKNLKLVSLLLKYHAKQDIPLAKIEEQEHVRFICAKDIKMKHSCKKLLAKHYLTVTHHSFYKKKTRGTFFTHLSDAQSATQADEKENHHHSDKIPIRTSLMNKGVEKN